MTEDWRNMFVGRETELGRLKSAWSAAKLNQPQVVSLVAESGLGKTRLVQEFFSWLSVTDDAAEGAGYWPDELSRIHKNRARREVLSLNPDPKDCSTDGRTVPFFWWAIQLPDCEDDPNRVVTSLSQYEYRLKTHLLAYLNAIHVSELRRDHAASGGGAAIDIGLNFAGEILPQVVLSAIPGGSLAFTLLSSLIDMGKWGYEAAQRELSIKATEAPIAPGQADQNQLRDISETILANLRVVCHSPPKPLDRVPLVLVIDDAQWIRGDLSLCKLITDLLRQAGEGGWPLLVIVTSWEAEWQSKSGIVDGTEQIVSIRSLFDQPGSTLSEIKLKPIAAFGEIIETAFPGLSLEQRDMVADKAEGNALCLYDILNYLTDRPQFFVDRNQKNALNQSDASALQSLAFDDIIRARITSAPDHVQTALGIGSLQGLRFSGAVVTSAAHTLKVAQADQGLVESENPYAFVMRESGDTVEFRARYYQRIASENLDKFVPRAAAEEAIRSALETIIPVASETAAESIESIWQSQLALFESNDTNQTTVAYAALYNLAVKAYMQKDYLAALQYARKWAGLWLNGKAGSSTTDQMLWIESVLRDLGDVRHAHDLGVDILKHARENLLRAKGVEPSGNFVFLEGELTHSLDRVASGLWLHGNYQELHQLHLEAYNLREEHFNKIGDAASTFNFAFSMAQVAASTEMVEGLDAAFDLYEKAVLLAEKYFALEPSEQAVLQVASARCAFGRALTEATRNEEAELILRAAREALLNFGDQSDSKKMLNKIYEVNNQLTHTLLRMNRFKDAKAAADQSLECLSKLETIWAMDWHKTAQRTTYIYIHDAAKEAGDFEAAAEALITGMELSRRDNEAGETIDTLTDLALFAERLFNLEKATDLDGALETIQSVLELKRKLISLSPTAHYIADKIYILDSLAETQLALTKFEEVDATIAEIEATLPSLFSAMKTDHDEERFIDCICKLGHQYRNRKRDDLALVKFKNGLERAYRLSAKAELPWRKRNVSLFLEGIALSYEAKADRKKAIGYLIPCRAIKEEIIGLSDGIQALQDLAIINEHMGRLLSTLDAREQAIDCFRRAWEVRCSLEKRLGAAGQAGAAQAEANLNWAKSLPIKPELTIVQISPWVAPKEWLQPKSEVANGRHALCPCGSGKRYKHCHGKM